MQKQKSEPKEKKNLTVMQFGIIEALRTGKVDGSWEWLESIDNRYIPGLITTGCLVRNGHGVHVTEKAVKLAEQYQIAKRNLPYRLVAHQISATVQLLLSFNKKEKVREINNPSRHAKGTRVA